MANAKKEAKVEAPVSKADKKQAVAADKAAKPEKPDEKAYEEKIAAKTKEIEVAFEKLKKLREDISSALDGKEEFEEAKRAHYDTLAEKNAKKAEIIGQLKAIREADRNQKKTEREAAQKLKSLSRECEQVFKEDELYPGYNIDVAIAALQKRMEVETMTLNEEKDCMRQIKKLKAERPVAERKLNELDQMKAEIEIAKENNTTQKVPKMSQETLEAERAKLQDEVNAEFEKLNGLKEQRNKKMDSVSGKREERDALSSSIDALKEERKKIQDEKREKQKKFNEWEKAERQKAREIKDAAYFAEAAAWEKEAAAKRLEMPTKYLEDIVLVKQTIEYCENLLPKEAKEEESKACCDFTNAPEGAKIMVSKKDRDTEMYFAATKKKNLKKKGSDKKKVLTHTPETFSVFDKLKMKTPMSVEDCASTLESLKAKLIELEALDVAEKLERQKKYDDAQKEQESQEKIAASGAAVTTTTSTSQQE